MKNRFQTFAFPNWVNLYRLYASADKLRAITELEQRSQEFLKEKKEKMDLEVRVLTPGCQIDFVAQYD